MPASVSLSSACEAGCLSSSSVVDLNFGGVERRGSYVICFGSRGSFPCNLFLNRVVSGGVVRVSGSRTCDSGIACFENLYGSGGRLGGVLR